MLNKRSTRLIVASGLAMAFASHTAIYAGQTVTQSITDVRQEVQIWTSYALNPHLRVTTLKASVKDGRATISGNVVETVSKELANEIALGIDGITSVDNRIVVVSGSDDQSVAPSNSFAEGVDDATITATVKLKLLWSKHTDELDSKVMTKAGRVTLSGTADSEVAKDLAGRLAMNTRGVVAVRNDLKIVDTKAPKEGAMSKAAAQVEQTISDGWITTKVKTTLLYSSNVSGTGIHVTTKAGVVTLKGDVSGRAESEAAIDLASNTLGVKAVDAKGLIF